MTAFSDEDDFNYGTTSVQSRFAETPTLTLTLNPNFGETGFGETGFGESGFGESGRHQPLTLISAKRVSAKRVSAKREDTTTFMDVSPLCQFAPRTFRPW